MGTMSVNALSAPSHAVVAGARDTAQGFIEDLRQPTSASKHAPGSQPPHVRTPGLNCATKGDVRARLARLRHRPTRPCGPVHRIRSHAEA